MEQKVKYEELVDIEKIIAMYKIIRANTKNRGKLHKFELFYSSNIISILEILKYKKYEHSHYNVFLVHEPKYRIIMSEIMSDKIINHLVSHYVLDPGITPHLIPQNVATRKGMGTKEGILSRFITDPDIYKLIKNIIESTDNKYVNESIKKVVNKEIERIKGMNILDKEVKIAELKSIPFYEIGKGLPIGNMTSQLLAIYFLNDLDHYIKEKLYCKYYVRYMDDFVIFDYDKERLKEIKNKIEEKLKEFKLELNRKTNIYDLKYGFGFLGYHFLLKGKRLIIKINSKTKRRIKKKMRKLKKINAPNYENVKASYMGYLTVAHSKNLLKKLDL